MNKIYIYIGIAVLVIIFGGYLLTRTSSKNNTNQNLGKSTSPVANMNETELVNLNMKKAELELVNPTNKVKPVANMSKADLTTLMTNVNVHHDEMITIKNRYKKRDTDNCEKVKAEFNTSITKFDTTNFYKLTIDNQDTFTNEDKNELKKLEIQLTTYDCNAVNRDDDDILEISILYVNKLFHLKSYIERQSGLLK